MKIFKRKFKNHLKLKDSGPIVFTGLSISGVIFTAAAAIHDTPKALKIIEHENSHRKFKAKVYKTENDEVVPEYEPIPLTFKDKVKLTWKCYIPTIIVAGTTCFCIIRAQNLNSKQKKELLAAYALVHTGYLEYRSKVKELIGDEAEADIRSAVAAKHVNDETHYGNGKETDKIIFIDEFANTVFESSIEEVQRAEYELNRTFALRGYVSVGDFYRYLGLDDVYADIGPTLERFGWSYDMGTDMGYEWIDFTHRQVKDAEQETYTLGYPFEPVLGYMY